VARLLDWKSGLKSWQKAEFAGSSKEDIRVLI